MSSDIPTPTPEPFVEDSWFQRPAFLATCALVVVLVGAIVWFVGREPERDPAVQTTVADSVTATEASPTDTPGSTLPVASSQVPTAPTTLVNPFGDVVGAPVAAPKTPAALFATAVQQSGDPATVATLHSPAYYYALWSRLTARTADPAARPVATSGGYSVDLVGGAVDLVDLGPAEGPIREGAELRAGIATSFAVGIQSTAVCLPDREPQCDLSGTNFAPDSLGSAGQMWALAKVVLDPDTDTWLMYVDLHGPHLVSATAASSVSVGLDQTLGIVAVTYAKNPPPGTVLTLVGTTDDGVIASFDFAVS